MKLADLKIAVGHDDLTVPYAGGEKVFAAIAETFPQADIFTSMITSSWRERLPGRKIATSFMQTIPLKRALQKALFMLYPLAFESFDLSDYDLVISSSSRFAHGVITRPETKHICYMHSPGRMFWEPDHYFGSNSRLKTLLTPALSYLRLWDHAAAQRVNQFIANSKNIAGKIKRYYGRDAEVVYPFVDLDRFKLGNAKYGDYFLVVTRLAPWKKVDIAVAAANAVGAKLKVVGIGPDEKRLKKMAGPGVEILGGVPDGQATELFQNCSALIMTQEEDFGITSLEAQACGKPVIAYGAGGALETVVAGKTGEFFASQDAEALAKVLKKFDPKRYRPEDCRANAENFSKGRFQKELTRVVSQVIEDK
jgi:glycosyltransferase involved in cell wall biosynthesis